MYNIIHQTVRVVMIWQDLFFLKLKEGVVPGCNRTSDSYKSHVKYYKHKVLFLLSCLFFEITLFYYENRDRGFHL